PDIRRNQCARAAKSVRRDADDRVRLPVDVKRAAYKIIVAAVAFPKTVACDDNSHVRIRFAFLGGIKPAAKRLHTHHREIILRSQKGEAAPHVVIAPDTSDGELEWGNINKHVPALFATLPLFVV